MPAKLKIPAPIDRPLSRAYLRQFTGWSTAYPPGMSDPTSLREMENVQTNRDGSIRVRPGLRFLSYRSTSDDPRKALNVPIVGTHEPFFLADGSKAYLFAARDVDGEVSFRAMATVDGVQSVYPIDDKAIGFTIDATAGKLAFSPKTTYVKYLQIDNKIFALSNAGEQFRYFTVGETKVAKRLNPISQPDWDPDDKLTVVHPTQAWILADQPTYTRYNRILCPAMGGDLSGWQRNQFTKMLQVASPTRDGLQAMSVESFPERTNLCTQPLHTITTVTRAGWTEGTGVDALSIVDQALSAHCPAGAVDRRCFVQAPTVGLIEPGETYQVAFTVVNQPTGLKGVLRWRWFTASGAPIGTLVNRFYDLKVGRQVVGNIVAPNGAATMSLSIGGYASTTDAKIFSFNNVLVSKRDESSAMFSGDSGPNYFWNADPGASRSLYHPPQDLRVFTRVAPKMDATPGSHCASVYVQTASTPADARVDISWRSKDDTTLDTATGTTVTDSTSWQRISAHGLIPDDAVEAVVSVWILGVPRGKVHYLDSAMFEQGTVPDVFFCGSTPDTDLIDNEWVGEPQNSASTQQVFTSDRGIPTAATPTGATLISDDPDKNIYSFGFFYTITNEIGESAASQVTVVRTRRAWNQFRWERPNAASEPSGTVATHAGMCADQLVAIMPQDVFNTAVDEGATGWNLYVFTWSDESPVPVVAVLGDSRTIDKTTHPYSQNGWLGITPAQPDTSDFLVLPTLTNRFNFTDPGAPAQGMVCADRMILVGDRTNPARIRWSSNMQGHYTDFSSHRGGGYKTLTSGNLFIPATVKLWQNPQSVDTITILCWGTDGYSTGYYMQPAQIASQTEATNIMGFEETTASPGTVSPFGCEVLNNALFHPLDEMLVKSTANNYNISHKSITELIANTWHSLQAKQRIVSCQHDNRLYYLVNNPAGAEVPDGCMGNEVWVYDTGLGSDKGTWSRWLTPGCSLRKIEQGNRVYMSLVHPDGIFYFDELYNYDEVVDPTTKLVSAQPIPWKMRTNTQGANRAHDAWCHLQQLNLYSGNFVGTMRYGIRSWDLNGMPVDISKKVTMLAAPPGPTQAAEDVETFDLDDYLLIRRDLREWSFFAESVTDDAGEVLPSFGQISLVQYRYTPVSVNVGYEFGSVETFEYLAAPDTVTNGVPVPYVDTRRP
jgi:hypothetical protein